MLRVGLLISGLAVAGALPLSSHWFASAPQSPESPQPAESHAENEEHPLAEVLELALETQRNLNSLPGTFRCRLEKQERIAGELQAPRVIEMYVREADEAGDEPFAARMDFQEPTELAGRKILFVEGLHDNRMLVRKGGKRLGFVTLKLDPRGWKARHESHVSITEVGFRRIMQALVLNLQQQMEADPDAANTLVEWNGQESLYNRRCRTIRITHPQPSEELCFYQAVVYIDCQWRVPVRIEAYDWPPSEEAHPPLLAEYTFRHLQFDPDRDDCFDPAALVD